jgi:uncharacterized membrane protein
VKRWDESIAISAPADKVFAYVSDFTRHGEWAGHGLQVTKEGDGPTAAGSTFSTTAKQFGMQRERSTVTDMNAPSMFAWDSVGTLGRVHHWFSMSESGGTTTLRKGAEMVEPKFLAKMTMFRINKDMPRNIGNDLAKIKSSVEGSAG